MTLKTKILICSLFVALILINTCASLPQPKPWTKQEKAFLVASLLTSVADYYTTERSLDNSGTREINPIIGTSPNDTELTIRGWGFYGIFLIAAHYLSDLRTPLLSCQIAHTSYWAISDVKKDREENR